MLWEKCRTFNREGELEEKTMWAAISRVTQMDYQIVKPCTAHRHSSSFRSVTGMALRDGVGCGFSNDGEGGSSSCRAADPSACC